MGRGCIRSWVPVFKKTVYVHIVHPVVSKMRFTLCLSALSTRKLDPVPSTTECRKAANGLDGLQSVFRSEDHDNIRSIGST